MRATGRSEGPGVPRWISRRVLYFSTGPAKWNAPYEFSSAPTTISRAHARLAEHAGELAAVLMDDARTRAVAYPRLPVCQGVFTAARAVGAVCIADEVMRRVTVARPPASPCAQADITTFGKYIGGGFHSARSEFGPLLDQYDTSPEGRRREVIAHCRQRSTTTWTRYGRSGGAARTSFTADVPRRTPRAATSSEQVAAGCRPGISADEREWLRINDVLHASTPSPTRVADTVRSRDHVLQELSILGLLEHGVYTAARGWSMSTRHNAMTRLRARCARRDAPGNHNS